MQHVNRLSEWKKYWILILDRSSADVTDAVTGHNFVCMEKHRSQQGETENINWIENRLNSNALWLSDMKS